MGSRSKTLPKSRSNTRISVMTGTLSNSKTSESTRLVYQHYHQYQQQQQQQQQQNVGHGGAVGGLIHGPSSMNQTSGGGGGAGGGRFTYEPLRPPSNPVEDCLRAGVAGLGWCLVSWLIGVFLLVFEYARRWGAHRSSDHFREPGPPWLIFGPFWAGDVLAIVVLAKIIMKVASVKFSSPARNRNARRNDSRERSSGNLSEMSGHGNNHGSGGNNFSSNTVTMDYFPLLQRVVLTSVGATVLLLILITEQVLVCLRWGREAGAPGVPPTLAIAAPLIILEMFFLLRVVLIRTQGWLSGITWMLLLVLTISVTLKSNPDPSHELSQALHAQPWLECLAPLWILDLLYAGLAGYVATNVCAERFVMTPVQGLCFALFALSLGVSTVAEVLLAGDQRFDKLTNRLSSVAYLQQDFPLVLVAVSLIMFYIAVFLSASHYVNELIRTQGFEDPLPLCETPSGWEWSGTGKAALGLLGDVSIRAEKKVGLPGGLTGNKAATVSSTLDMNAAEVGFTNRYYERTDSGQYVDIYDSLT